MNDDTNGGRGSLRGIRRCLSAVIGPRVAETFVRQSARGRCVKPHLGACGDASHRREWGWKSGRRRR